MDGPRRSARTATPATSRSSASGSTCENEQDQPLMFEIFERFSDHADPPEFRGAFAPAKGEATVSELVVAKPWLRAFDQTGTLVYATPLQLKESQTVTIGSGPLAAGEIPQ